MMAAQPTCTVVWIGGVDDHYRDHAMALADADEWREKGYDDVVVVPCDECGVTS